MSELIRVRVVYALPTEHFWRELELAEGSSVHDAIDASGVLRNYPAIDLERQRVGVFGRFVRLDAALADGDRVEIYRPARRAEP